MGRTTAARYVTPLKSDGSEATFAPGADATLTGRGVFTLAANTTYYFPLSEADGRVASVELEIDAAIIVTDAHIEDTNTSKSEVLDYAVNNAWVPETPSSGYIATKNGNVTSSTNSTLVTGGGTAGAAIWNLVDTATKRGRLSVSVGATGGEARVSTWAKE